MVKFQCDFHTLHLQWLQYTCLKALFKRQISHVPNSVWELNACEVWRSNQLNKLNVFFVVSATETVKDSTWVQLLNAWI